MPAPLIRPTPDWGRKGLIRAAHLGDAFIPFRPPIAPLARQQCSTWNMDAPWQPSTISVRPSHLLRRGTHDPCPDRSRRHRSRTVSRDRQPPHRDPCSRSPNPSWSQISKLAAASFELAPRNAERYTIENARAPAPAGPQPIGPTTARTTRGEFASSGRNGCLSSTGPQEAAGANRRPNPTIRCSLSGSATGSAQVHPSPATA